VSATTTPITDARVRLGRFASELVALSDRIWESPELGCSEHAASAAQRALLERHGFELEAPLAGLDTAFVARRSIGTGGPSIGLLGEFDALPGLSQDRVPYRKALVDSGAGHGCGHNLLGTGALGAALLAADLAEAEGLPLELAYFGCPDEEGIVGKVVMARERVFDGLDAALSWHPSELNTLWDGSALALDGFSIRFTGRTAHAAANPHSGRSALDAVELTNVAINYLREHMPPEARIHYVIRSGGFAPNIVPDYAAADYRVRERTREDVDRLRERVFNCARGAALMTDTQASWKLINACSSLLPNDALARVLLDALQQVGPPTFDEEDRAFGRAIRETLPADELEEHARSAALPHELRDAVLHERVDPPFRPGLTSSGSTDVGDVSWSVPTSQLLVSTMPIGTPGHTWQVTASSGSAIGAKGMLTAAAALGVATVELARRPEHLAAAGEEFARRTGGRRYQAPVPAGVAPRSDLVPAEDDGQGWILL
jgi:aminobenzoyl-glutamate utilization protein B